MSEQTEAQGKPIAATYEGMLQLALAGRRGSLMKAAPLPKPEECTEEDIPVLCKNIESLNTFIGELIDLVGEKERKLNLALEAHAIRTEGLDDMLETLDSMRAQIISVRDESGELLEEMDAD
jgi:hypothetical protein